MSVTLNSPRRANQVHPCVVKEPGHALCMMHAYILNACVRFISRLHVHCACNGGTCSELLGVASAELQAIKMAMEDEKEKEDANGCAKRYAWR